jgi:hypothetical protein
MSLKMFYFGCWNEKGHHLYTVSGASVPSRVDRTVFPFRESILDAGLLPVDDPQIQGKSTLSHISGWTILSFWDRSVDDRFGSNSAFLIKGTYTFDEVVNFSKAFVKVWSRLNFTLSEYEAI